MRTLMALVLAVLLCFGTACAKQTIERQKFDVTVTILYDNCTLKDAADLEQEVLTVFPDAKVSTTVRTQSDGISANISTAIQPWYYGTGVTYTDEPVYQSGTSLTWTIDTKKEPSNGK